MHTYFANYSIDLVHENTKAAKATNIILLYVIHGSCIYTARGERRELKTQAVTLINMNEVFDLEMQQKSLICRIAIDYFALCSSIGKGRIFFGLDSTAVSDLHYLKLCEILQDLLLLHLNAKSSNDYQELGIYCLLLDHLIENYQIKRQLSNAEISDERIVAVMEYIYENCNGEINLQNIADKFYMSMSAISRMFFKATGEHLKHYVNRIRLERVAEELVSSEGTVCRIAVNNGFTSQSALNREFKKEYGDVPSEYRLKMRRKREEDEATEEEREKINEILSKEQLQTQNKKKQLTIIAGDVSNVTRVKKWENKILNVGTVYALASAKMQNQILMLYGRLKVKYIRIWNIFDHRLMMQTGHRSKLNFARMDEVFDFCVDHQIQLFLDMSPRRTITMASEKTEIYSKEENIEFTSEQLWLEALDGFLKHISTRYGQCIVGEWVFEFAYFLNGSPYYIDPHYSSRRVWKLGYDMVKRNIQDAKVAGPGIIGTEDREFLELLIDNFLTDNRKPDIFTGLVFPYAINGDGNQEYTVYGDVYQRVTDPAFFAKQAELILEVLKQKKFQGEYYVTDWGYSVANRNFIQDSCFRGTFILDSIIKNHGKADALGIFCASDLLNVFSDTSSILAGSSGIISRDGICKPAYYAFEFLGQLGRFLIAENKNAIITSESDSDIRIICYNECIPGMQYFMAEENYYHPEEISRLFVNLDSLRLRIKLKTDTRKDVWKMHQKILNEKKGSVLNKWIEFGCVEKLPREDIEYLRQTSVPEVCLEQLETVNGILDFEVTLEPNEMRFIQLIRE